MFGGREIGLVDGYHECASLPREATTNDLRWRFAVVMDTDRKDNPDWYFDFELYSHLLQEMVPLITHSEERVLTFEEQELDSLAAALAHLRGIDDGDREPFREIRLAEHGYLAALIVTEYWAFCGGPSPYSDSYTLSFFTREYLGEEFRAACCIVCERIGAEIVRECTASPTPVHSPWWKRVLRKLS